MSCRQTNRMKKQIQVAIQDPERYSLHFIYISNNKVSIRAVSPYGWQGGNRFIGLCLSRQDPRSFCLDQILKLSLVRSSEIRMPFPLTEVEVEKKAAAQESSNQVDSNGVLQVSA